MENGTDGGENTKDQYNQQARGLHNQESFGAIAKVQWPRTAIFRPSVIKKKKIN